MEALELTQDEAKRVIAERHPRLGEHVVEKVAGQFASNPLLLKMWCDTRLPVDHSDDPETSMIVVANKFLEQAIAEEAAKGERSEVEIRRALEALARVMLETRRFYPTWPEIIDSLEPDGVDSLRRLCSVEKLCRISGENFEFRHDRILESVLELPIASFLDDVDAFEATLADPYFAEIIGRSVVARREVALLDRMFEVSPIVLVSCLKHIDDEGDFLEAATKHVKGWIEELVAQDPVADPIIREIARMLERTASAAALSVTAGVAEDSRFTRARLANGDAVPQINSLGCFDGAFLPGFSDSRLESVVWSTQARHRDALLKQVSQQLRCKDQPSQQLTGALILAGYLGFPELANEVLQVWEQRESSEILLEALWAQLRCSGIDPAKTLDPLLEAWAGLSAEADGDGFTERNSLAEELQMSMRHGLPDAVVQLLVKRSLEDERLAHEICELFLRLDHPAGVVRAAEMGAGSDEASLWILLYWRSRDPLHGGYALLTENSKIALRDRWIAEQDPSLRESLREMWIRTTSRAEEFDGLPEEDALTRSAIWRRAQLGDMRVAGAILSRLQKDLRLFSVIHHVWIEAFTETLDQALAELAKISPADELWGCHDAHSTLSKALRDIPEDRGRELLLKYWNPLGTHQKFFQVALYIGGEELCALAHEGLDSMGEGADPFALVSFTFGFKNSEIRHRVSDKHVDSLLPYAARLGDMVLLEIAEWLRDHGRSDDYRKFLEAEIESRVEAQRDEGDKSYIVRCSRFSFPTDEDLFEGLRACHRVLDGTWRWCGDSTERGDSPERRSAVLRAWLKDEPTAVNLLVCCKVVSHIGRREDLEWLKECQAGYGDPASEAALEGAAFTVKRRTLV